MKVVLDGEKFDTKVEASDWRYSAAIVGLYKYLGFYGEKGIDFEISDDAIKFHSSDITEDKYLEFVEHYYDDELQHKKIERMMYLDEYSDDQIKIINELLRGNSILKKTFGKKKFDGTNQKEILNLIKENRGTLIKETYRNKSNMYANFANTGQLLKEGKSCCRLCGYYVNGGKKSKAISYNFDTNTFVAQDDILFDFIPFGFSGDREVFFINDNFSVEQLINTNIDFERFIKEEITISEKKSKDARKVLFQSIQTTADFLDYDVEVIVKNREMAFFETLYIRKESIDILKELKVYEPFCFSLKINDNYYMNIQKKVIDCILNLIRTDELIELFLKRDSEYLVSQFIKINQLICGGGEEMKQSMRGAYACAKEVAKKLPENKRESYRQKLTSAIVFKDYDRCCLILLQLSNYSDVKFDFAYSLFEDFEANKDIAYTFINALTKDKENRAN
ncbi:MAG: type I CRISPR-associated protein Cas8a1/Csx8 [Lachnospiraceae bacterium]|nr:type I CRISPR-associated protein Cas8a1/Csx8 [Lachnospiraceae bacterium]